MSTKQIELKAISELFDMNFFIPSYQRGYRWESKQVEDLLDDINEFSKKDNKNPRQFYCLQPFVVKSEEVVIDNTTVNRYRVIDGQQRLTTIFIILKYLENLLLEEHAIENIYKLTYETRNEGNESSSDFLDSITTTEIKSMTNIDFHYMSNTFLVISEWFKNNIANKNVSKRRFLETIVETDISYSDDKKYDESNNIRVIWYEIEDENEIDVFTRLNTGKIPLTSSELIKALFLLKIVDNNEKIILASEWDNIEARLQEESFFGFVNAGLYNKDTRIDFIIDMIASDKQVKIDNILNDDEKKSYYIYNELISTRSSAEEEWDLIKTNFRVLEELFSDNKYYHLVGFLIHEDFPIKTIVNKFKINKKNDFYKFLLKEIKNKLKFKNIEELNYIDDYPMISKILFLFNVISTMNSQYTRYPFDKHKEEVWSLEHIHAQRSKDIKKDEHKIALLKSQMSYVEDTIKNELRSLVFRIESKEKKESYEDDFHLLQDKIFRLFSEDKDINIHTIDNLALLSRKDNSALNNSIFPSKRDKIKILDKDGSFIPIGTKNVFLKHYSDNVSESIKWNKKDRDSYLISLKETVLAYTGGNHE